MAKSKKQKVMQRQFIKWDGWMDDGWMNGWMDGWMDGGQMDGYGLGTGLFRSVTILQRYYLLRYSDYMHSNCMYIDLMHLQTLDLS